MDKLRGFAPIGILEEWNIGIFNGQIAMVNHQ